jgi:hypothetical protein
VRGTAFGITISGKGHRRRFHQAWASSNGHVTFLGDWHTHPSGPVTPSHTDHRAMLQLAEDSDYGTPEPLIAIASVPRLARARDIEIGFYLRRTDGRVLTLEPTIFPELPDVAQAVPDWPWPSRRTPRTTFASALETRGGGGDVHERTREE